MERSSYSLRSAGKQRRDFHVVKFRTELPAMRDKHATVEIAKGVGRTDPPLTLTVAGKSFDGTREAAGTSSAKSSSYMLFRVDAAGKVTAMPAASWFSFKPTIQYDTLTIEEVEEREGGGKPRLPGMKKPEGARQTNREKLANKFEQACAM